MAAQRAAAAKKLLLLVDLPLLEASLATMRPEVMRLLRPAAARLLSGRSPTSHLRQDLVMLASTAAQTERRHQPP